jgi:hypothetical protein
VAAKLFASVYALASGFVFLVTAGVIGAPWIHRLLHRLHADPEDVSPEARPAKAGKTQQKVHKR